MIAKQMERSRLRTEFVTHVFSTACHTRQLYDEAVEGLGREMPAAERESRMRQLLTLREKVRRNQAALEDMAICASMADRLRMVLVSRSDDARALKAYLACEDERFRCTPLDRSAEQIIELFDFVCVYCLATDAEARTIQAFAASCADSPYVLIRAGGQAVRECQKAADEFAGFETTLMDAVRDRRLLNILTRCSYRVTVHKDDGGMETFVTRKDADGQDRMILLRYMREAAHAGQLDCENIRTSEVIFWNRRARS